MFIVLEDAASIDLDTSSTITITTADYSGIIINPTSKTAEAAGVTLYPIPSSVANTYDGTSGKLKVVGTPKYGFIVVQGRVAALAGGSPAGTGQGISPSSGTAGAVDIASAGTAVLGIASIGGVTGEAQPVFLNL